MKASVRQSVEFRAQSHCEARFTSQCRWWGNQTHHRKRKSQGGKDELANLLWVCGPCHDKIHKYPNNSYERGFMVKQTGNPEDIAVVAG